MRATAKTRSRPLRSIKAYCDGLKINRRRCLIPVPWHDCAWRPRIKTQFAGRLGAFRSLAAKQNPGRFPAVRSGIIEESNFQPYENYK